MTTDANTTSNNKLQPGTYPARAVSWAWDTTKETGAIFLRFVLRLTAESGHSGYELDGRLYFDTDRTDDKGRTAADRSMETLRAMGLKGGIDAIDENTGGLSEGEVSVVVDYNDKGYPRAKWINPPRKARELRTFAAPSRQDKAAFFASMRERIVTEPVPQNPPDDFGSGGGTNDDIPF